MLNARGKFWLGVLEGIQQKEAHSLLNVLPAEQITLGILVIRKVNFLLVLPAYM